MIARLSSLAAPALAKAVLVLAVAVAALLPLSGWLGWRLAVSGIECRAEREKEIAVATEQGRAQALQEAADRGAQIARDAVVDQTALLTDLAAIADRAQQTRTVYRTQIKTIPAASCAPGAERVNAANALIAGEAE